MRLFAAGILLPALSLTACTAKPALAPRVTKAERDGITLVADPGAWNAKPTNLNNYAVALAVTVNNRGTLPINVRGEDFVLYQGAREHERTRDGGLVHVQHTLARLEPRAPNEALPIAVQAPSPLVGTDAMTLAQAEMTERTSEMVESEAWAQSDRFLVYRGPKIYFVGPVTYYGTPDSFYLVAQPAPKSDLQALALSDGILEPGESRRGFLYFTRPKSNARQFTLSWQPEPLEANEMDGAPAEPLTLTFARG